MGISTVKLLRGAEKHNKKTAARERTTVKILDPLANAQQWELLGEKRDLAC